MKKTKIICTIGPACESEEMLEKLMLAGMDVARLNFSHGTHEEHKRRINAIKKVREKLGLPVAIMLDTKGPEYRLRRFACGKVTLKEGDPFTFTSEDILGDETRVSVNPAEIVREIAVGETILVCNGLVKFRVVKKDKTNLYCVTEIGGTLSDNKSMSFPGKVLCRPYLSMQDKADLVFGIENEVDFIACSFVSRASDVQAVQDFLITNGGHDIELIAKIENRSGVDNLEKIAAECSGIMVARGDLGVEIPFIELPSLQKKIITACRLMGKRVITATEMLESMIHSARPTRAEISDVANAVYDGSSAIMLSGETAAGNYPDLAVRTMAEIAEETERHIDYRERFHQTDFRLQNTLDAISHAAVGMALDIEASAIGVFSVSGITCRMISRFRPTMPILGMTPHESASRKLALSWGVIPVVINEYDDRDKMFAEGVERIKDKLNLSSGERVVLTGGQMHCCGSTNLIQMETVCDACSR
ncbi:MAG: pyruvate kinase [Clostridia bacterium]|nr:pyruvate kinase [Clostridia bacterium]